MWRLYVQHIDDPTSILDMANRCLTFLESRTVPKGKEKKRDAAARTYKIQEDILNTLGRLVSTRGDELEARKFHAGTTPVPLTDQERKWIRAAVKMLIRRKGEYDFDSAAAASLPQITMADLPSLQRPGDRIVDDSGRVTPDSVFLPRIRLL
jgi:hypothetical protein